MQDDVGRVEDVRATVVARLRARQPELVRRIFARVRGDGFPRVGVDDAEYVAGLGAAVEAAVEYVITVIERGGEGVGPIPVVVCEQARRAARFGVSLDMVLRRYVVGHSLLEEVIMEEPARGEREGWALGHREALREALRAQASVLDRLLAAITSEYGDELARVGRSPEQRRYERVRRLLEGDAVDGDELDYDLAGWHVGAIARGGGCERVLRDLALGLDRRLLCVQAGHETVWAWLGSPRALEVGVLERALRGAFRFRSEVVGSASGVVGSEVAVGGFGVAGEDPHGLPAVVWFAVGEPARDLKGWRLTHRQAQAASVVAQRRDGSEPGGVTRYGEVMLLAAALKDEALGRALVDVYIAPLEGSRGGSPALCETLRAYLAAECSASSAAAALGVARKTVASRLRTIEERLGRSLHPCPAEIEVALELDALTAAAPETSMFQ